MQFLLLSLFFLHTITASGSQRRCDYQFHLSYSIDELKYLDADLHRLGVPGVRVCGEQSDNGVQLFHPKKPNLNLMTIDESYQINFSEPADFLDLSNDFTEAGAYWEMFHPTFVREYKQRVNDGYYTYKFKSQVAVRVHKEDGYELGEMDITIHLREVDLSDKFQENRPSGEVNKFLKSSMSLAYNSPTSPVSRIERPIHQATLVNLSSVPEKHQNAIKSAFQEWEAKTDSRYEFTNELSSMRTQIIIQWIKKGWNKGAWPFDMMASHSDCNTFTGLCRNGHIYIEELDMESLLKDFEVHQSLLAKVHDVEWKEIEGFPIMPLFPLFFETGEQFLAQYMRAIVSHEIVHIHGVAHNFGTGSLAVIRPDQTISLPTVSAYLPRAFEALITGGPGQYDLEAMDYIYNGVQPNSNFPNCTHFEDRSLTCNTFTIGDPFKYIRKWLTNGLALAGATELTGAEQDLVKDILDSPISFLMKKNVRNEVGISSYIWDLASAVCNVPEWAKPDNSDFRSIICNEIEKPSND